MEHLEEYFESDLVVLCLGVGTMDSPRNIYRREIEFRALALEFPEFAKRYAYSLVRLRAKLYVARADIAIG